jgi:hypothetical protein
MGVCCTSICSGGEWIASALNSCQSKFRSPILGCSEKQGVYAFVLLFATAVWICPEATAVMSCAHRTVDRQFSRGNAVLCNLTDIKMWQWIVFEVCRTHEGCLPFFCL